MFSGSWHCTSGPDIVPSARPQGPDMGSLRLYFAFQPYMQIKTDQGDWGGSAGGLGRREEAGKSTAKGVKERQRICYSVIYKNLSSREVIFIIIAKWLIETNVFAYWLIHLYGNSEQVDLVHQPHTDCIPTTYRTHANHIPTAYRPHTDRIPNTRELLWSYLTGFLDYRHLWYSLFYYTWP